jgi:hypothetical protein
MNEVHTLQRTDTAEGEGIAQGVIQRESQYVGRKKHALWQCECSRRQPNMVASSASRPNSLTLSRLGRPSLRVPLHLIVCKPRLDIFAHAIPSSAKDMKVLSVRWSTSGSRRTLVFHP